MSSTVSELVAFDTVMTAAGRAPGAGASGSPLVESLVPCPLLDAYAAFQRADERVVQLVELEDGSRWFTSSRCVSPPGGWAGAVKARFVVTLGLAAEAAKGLAAAPT